MPTNNDLTKQYRSLKKTITIKAPASEVWRALTEPEIVKQYFYDTNVDSDWQQGSPIIYSGVWEGKAYKDKGKIVQVEKEKVLKHTHWSSLSGVPDTPENYYTVMYELNSNENKTILSITQEGNMTKEGADHSGKNWENVLEKLKDLLEKHPVHS
jgi:uncharacterized protein YndB with AHSA1/START domain